MENEDKEFIRFLDTYKNTPKDHEDRKSLLKDFNLVAFLGKTEKVGVSLQDLANEQGYAVFSVYRWRDGVSRPHSSLLPPLIDAVGQMVALKHC